MDGHLEFEPLKAVGMAPGEPPFVLEEVTDLVEIARSLAQHERAKKNSDWLQAHWADVLPQARGKFLAVAGQEAFLGHSTQEAWAKAKAAHPEDDGALSQYVLPQQGSRIYAIFPWLRFSEIV